MGITVSTTEIPADVDVLNCTLAANTTAGGLCGLPSPAPIPHYLNISKELPLEYARPMYGFITPVFLVVTIVANTLIVVVLSKRHMRTSTNAVLMAMALSDMFTLLFPAPWLFYMYTFGNHYKPLSPVSACFAWTAMNEVLPAMFHTASIWLTLALALQRYIYVCHAPVARTYCSMPRVLKLIGIIFFCAACHQAPRLFDRTYRPLIITWEGNPDVMVCRVDMAYWVTDVLTMDVYFFSYYMFRVLFVHLTPCISLVVLNVLLFKALRQAQDKRDKLLKENRKSECRKLRDSNCTTLMLIVVVAVFLMVEIPLAVVTTLHIISSSVRDFLNYTIVNTLILFTNFFIIISYPINFAIYCGMSRQFRETFRELFLNGGGPSKTRRGQRLNHRPTGGGESSHYTLVNNGPSGQRTCTETAL
ncbi:hypothetical protein ONE63_003278 [Megalurothrips usitatus]|uniref:G-protein coupled receptors family 1 profile domain-containing protein n=1 Tax=Megalurothrips usitatus TaxID=439358 RepID=A0AAV7XDD9_9NEOP|nr:hypothetical protein ONE63_003278 [Megalurothrips usitatus]